MTSSASVRQPRASRSASVSGLPRGRVDGPACGGEALGGRAADPARAARDEARWWVGSWPETIGRWPASSISTGCRRSTRGSSPRRSRTRTCTSAGSRCSRASAPALEEFLAHISLAPAPRAALPPEAGRAAAARPGGRCGSTTRTSTSPTTCATPRCPSRATRSSCWRLAARVFSQRLDRTKPLWELWLVEGARDDALRADVQDPPRARRRRLRRRPRQRAVRPRARGPGRSTATTVGPAPEPSGARARRARAHRRGATRSREVAAGALGAVAEARRALDARARGGRRASARSRGPALNPAPATPLNVPHRPAPALRVVRARPRRAQAGQGRVRRHRQRRRARGRRRRARPLLLQSRGAPHRRARAAARWCRSRSAPRTSAARSATGSPRSCAPLPVYIDDPVARLRFVQRAMDGLKESEQALGARGDRRRCRASRRRRSSPRRRGCTSRRASTTCSSPTCPGPQFPLYVLGRELRSLPVPSWPESARWRSRSSPTTAASASGCSATTTRCPTSTSSPRASRRRSPSS